jgi:hypothetical protein
MWGKMRVIGGAINDSPKSGDFGYEERSKVLATSATGEGIVRGLVRVADW